MNASTPSGSVGIEGTNWKLGSRKADNEVLAVSGSLPDGGSGLVANELFVIKTL